MSDLCWKCREKIPTSMSCLWDVLHCHHEPKEKEKCWCETNSCYFDAMAGTHKPKFCPECGKKL